VGTQKIKECYGARENTTSSRFGVTTGNEKNESMWAKKKIEQNRLRLAPRGRQLIIWGGEEEEQGPFLCTMKSVRSRQDIATERPSLAGW